MKRNEHKVSKPTRLSRRAITGHLISMRTPKDLGLRKLRITDIVREGDLQWTKTAYELPQYVEDLILVDWCIGMSMTDDKLIDFGNNIYRRLKS